MEQKVLLVLQVQQDQKALLQLFLVQLGLLVQLDHKATLVLLVQKVLTSQARLDPKDQQVL